jgi:hypothetical protein
MNPLLLFPEIINYEIKKHSKSNSNSIPSRTGGNGAILSKNVIDNIVHTPFNILESVTNFLERKNPGSSSNIKIHNANNLYNNIKNNNPSNFPLGPSDDVNKILHPWFNDFKPSTSQIATFKKYYNPSPLQVLSTYGQK